MKTLKIILTLTLTCIFSAGVLSLSFNLTKGKIEENQKKAVNEAIFKIIKQADKIIPITAGKTVVYKTLDKKGNIAGFAFIAQGPGYQGKISILCAAGPHFKKLLGIEIIESLETPGLGAKINENWFKKQFHGLSTLRPITYGKKQNLANNQIQAITGATISSRSVVKIINKTLEKVKKITGNGEK